MVPQGSFHTCFDRKKIVFCCCSKHHKDASLEYQPLSPFSGFGGSRKLKLTRKGTRMRGEADESLMASSLRYHSFMRPTWVLSVPQSSHLKRQFPHIPNNTVQPTDEEIEWQLSARCQAKKIKRVPAPNVLLPLFSMILGKLWDFSSSINVSYSEQILGKDFWLLAWGRGSKYNAIFSPWKSS